MLTLLLFQMHFQWYDRLVEYRQKIVLKKAIQSTKIVSSLFPKNVRDKLLQKEDVEAYGLGTKSKLKGFVNDREKFEDDNNETEEAIAGELRVVHARISRPRPTIIASLG